MLIRSFTFFVLWFFARHRDLGFLGGCFSVPMCCHAGRVSLSSREMFMGANTALCFIAALTILNVSSPSLSARFPFVGMFHLCRKAFTLVFSSRLAGVVSFISMSVMCAHVALVCVRFRYSFSHISSIASFLILRFSNLIPPILFSLSRCVMLNLGAWLVSSHINSLISFVSAILMLSGMPCAFVTNWVRPPTIAWVIKRFLSRVGRIFFHLSKSLCTRSMIGSQGFVSTVLFPT